VKGAINTAGLIGSVPKCFAKAGDCAAGLKAYSELTLSQPMTSTLSPATLKTNFEMIHPSCKGK
jgi:hypothetical protein